jgi:hypothetical protein
VEERIQLRHKRGRFRFRKWRRFINQDQESSPLVLIEEVRTEEEEEKEEEDPGLPSDHEDYDGTSCWAKSRG